MNRRPSHAIRSVASGITDDGADRPVPHADIADPNNAAPIVSDRAGTMRRPAAHRFAHLAAVRSRHLTARAAQHSRSAIDRPLQSP